MYLQNPGLTLRMAAELCGANVHYVAAAVTILQTEDHALREAVLAGKVPLLQAATAMKSTAKLIAAYRASDGADKFSFAQAVSPETVWDEVVEPACGSKANGSAPVTEEDSSVTIGNLVDAMYAAQ